MNFFQRMGMNILYQDPSQDPRNTETIQLPAGKWHRCEKHQEIQPEFFECTGCKEEKVKTNETVLSALKGMIEYHHTQMDGLDPEMVQFGNEALNKAIAAVRLAEGKK